MGTLTSSGLVIRRLPEVLEDIVASERANIDPDISTEDDEVLGLLNSVIGAAIAEQEALAEAVNNNFSLLTAEGVHLDNLVALIGITRIVGEPSYVDTQQVTGKDGTIIPAGSLMENPITLERFVFLDAVTLTTISCQSALYSVKDLFNSTAYTITINGNDVTYTSDASATKLEILNGLKSYNDSTYPTAAWDLTVDTGNEQLLIETNDGNNISITSITYIGSDSVTTFGYAESVEVGGILAPTNSVTAILTAVSGWESTTNVDAYTTGRETETDEELRARALVSQQISGRGTVEAIQDTVRNIDGVVSATVQENDTTFWQGGTSVVTFTNATDKVNWTGNTVGNGDRVMFSTTGTLPTGLSSTVLYYVVNQAANDFKVSLTAGGAAVDFTTDGTGTATVYVELPPKSFEVVVQGGADADVALAIWESKPAGVQTFGIETEVVEDSDGIERTIRFTRPAAVDLNFEVDYEVDTEGSPPSAPEIEDAIQAAVVNLTSQLAIGQDVVPSKYYGPIYAAVEGIIVTRIEVERQTGGGLMADLLSINDNEYASVTALDVTVTVIP